MKHGLFLEKGLDCTISFADRTVTWQSSDESVSHPGIIFSDYGKYQLVCFNGTPISVSVAKYTLVREDGITIRNDLNLGKPSKLGAYLGGALGGVIATLALSNNSE